MPSFGVDSGILGELPEPRVETFDTGLFGEFSEPNF